MQLVQINRLADTACTLDAKRVPNAPCDARGRDTACTIVLCQRIQKCVRSRKRAVVAGTPNTRNAAEQHKRIQRIVIQQFGQVQCTIDLRGHACRERFWTGILQRRQIGDTRSVQNCANSLAVRSQFVQQCGDGFAICHVARRQRDTSARSDQLVTQTLRARGVRATTAGQHQVLRVLGSQPAGQDCTQRTRTTGDNHRTTWLPATTCCTLLARDMRQTADESAARTQGQLIFGTTAAQTRAQHAGNARITHTRQIDQTTPAICVLQSRHLAQTPDQATQRRMRVRVLTRCHCLTRNHPQRCTDARTTQGADQRQAGGQTARHRRVVTMTLFIQTQEAHNARRRGTQTGNQATQALSQTINVRVRIFDCQLNDFRTRFSNCIQASGNARIIQVTHRNYGQPAARQDWCTWRIWQTFKGGAVTPCVNSRCRTQALTPVSQSRQDGAQRRIRGNVQFCSEGVQVGVLHSFPKCGVTVRCRTVTSVCSGAIQPVTLMLKCVRRQINGACAWEQRRPINRMALHIQAGSSAQNRTAFVVVRTQRRDGGHRRRSRVGTVANHAGQRTRWAQLNKGTDAGIQQRRDTIRKTDRFAHLTHPVLRGAPLFRINPRTGHVADDTQARDAKCHALNDTAKLTQHRLHQRGMERMAHRQTARTGTACSNHTLDAAFRTRDHDLTWRVHACNHHILTQETGQLASFRANSNHDAASRQGLHQTCTSGHNAARVLQAPQTRHACRGQLADGVANQATRTNAPALQQTKQRDFQGEQAGLCPNGTVQLTRVATKNNLAYARTNATTHLIKRFCKHRETLIQAATHAQALATLACENESQTTGRAACHATNTTTLRDLAQTTYQLVATTANHHRTMLEGRTSRNQGPTHVDRRALTNELAQLNSLGLQRAFRTSRQNPRHNTTGVRLRFFALFRRLFNDHVRVGTANTEARNCRTARVTCLRPLAFLGQQTNLTRRPVNMRARLVCVQGRWQDAFTQRHDHFDNTAHTRCRLRVADIGLQRTQPQRALSRTALAIGRLQGLSLNRIAQFRTGAMCFDNVHLGCLDASVDQRLANNALLCWAARRRQAIARAILVNRRTAHHRQHTMAQTTRIAQTLNHQHTDTFRQTKTVGRCRKGFTTAVRRQTTLTAELDQHAGARHDRHTTSQSHVAITGTQRLTCFVQCHQAARTCRINRQRRTFQTQGIAQTTACDAASATQEQVTLHRTCTRGRLTRTRTIILGNQAQKNASTAATQAMGVQTRILNRFPGAFQSQTLLRVHRQCLTRANTKELRIKFSCVVQKAALTLAKTTRTRQLRIVTVRNIPATISRQRTNCVDTGQNGTPQVGRCTNAARVTARHTHDRNWFVMRHRTTTRSWCRLGICARAEQFGVQVCRQCVRGRMIKHNGRRQTQTGCGMQAITDAHRCQRRDTQVTERATTVNATLIVAVQRGSCAFTNNSQQLGTTLRWVQRCQACAQNLMTRVAIRALATRTRRQNGFRQASRLARRQNRTQIGITTADMQFGQARQEAARTTLTTAQRTQDSCCVRGTGCAHLHRRSQDRMWAYLHKRGMACLQGCTGRVRETYSGAQITTPVRRVHWRAIQCTTMQRRINRDARRMRTNRRDVRANTWQDRVNVRAVSRQAHVNATRVDTFGGQVCDQFRRSVQVTARDRATWTVFNRHNQATRPTAVQQVRQFIRRQQNADHVTTTRQRSLRLAPTRHDASRIVQGQNTRDMRGCQFTQGVTQQCTRCNASRVPQISQRNHNGEQRRLDDVRANRLWTTCCTGDAIQQAVAQVRGKRVCTVVQLTRENRCGVQQFTSHTGPLRALTREHKHRASRACIRTSAGENCRVVCACAQRCQCVQGLGTVACQNNGTVGIGTRTRTGQQRLTDARRGPLGARTQVRAQCFGACANRRCARTGQYPRQDGAGTWKQHGTTCATAMFRHMAYPLSDTRTKNCRNAPIIAVAAQMLQALSGSRIKKATEQAIHRSFTPLAEGLRTRCAPYSSALLPASASSPDPSVSHSRRLR